MTLVRTVEMRVLADAGDAQAKLDALDAKAKALESDAIRMRFRVDDAAGKAQLDGLKAQADRLGLKDVVVKVRVDGAGRAIGELAAVRAAADEAGGGGGGLLGRLFGSDPFNRGGGGGTGLGGLLGGLAGKSVNLPGPLPAIPAAALPALIPLLGALPLAAGLLSGAAGAGAGLGALGALAYPTLLGNNGLFPQLSGVKAAANTYQTASANLGTAIGQSPADMKAYQAVLKGLEPDLARAAVQLRNQNLTWQAMTPAQQRATIALRNNAAAYKTLLPSQKDALNALIKEGDAWNQLTPAQQKAATAVQGVGSVFGKMAATMAPQVLGFTTQLANLAQAVLPKLLPLAQAASTALGPLLTQLGKGLNSQGFQQFITSLSKITGPAIGAIGTGIGGVAVQIGKLLTVMSGKDAAHSINILFSGISFGIQGITLAVTGVMKAWDSVSHGLSSTFNKDFGDLKHFGHDIEAPWNSVISFFGSIPGKIKAVFSGAGGWLKAPGIALIAGFEGGARSTWSALLGWISGLGAQITAPFKGAIGWLFSAGKDMIQGLINGIRANMPSLQSIVGGIANSIPGVIKHLLGIGSPSRVMRVIGQQSGEGLVLGLADSARGVMAASRQLATATASGYATAGGGYGRGGGDTYNISFPAMVHTQDSVRQAVQAFKEYKRHGGGAPLGIA